MIKRCSTCKHKKEEGTQYDNYLVCTKHGIVIKGEKSVCERGYEPNAETQLIARKKEIGYIEW